MSVSTFDRHTAVDVILDCVKGLPAASGISSAAMNESLPLLGSESPLDSLGLVTLIVDVEQRLSLDHDLTVTLASESAMSRRQSPFRTVSSFADYICEL